MSLRDDLQKEYVDAFKQKLWAQKMVLSLVLAQIKNKEKDLGKELLDEEITSIIKKEVKQILETISFLKKANKKESLWEEQEKLAILEKYLPVLMSEEDTKRVLDEIIVELWIDDIPANMWKIMWRVMGKYKWQINGALVRKLLSE